jgi:prophage regulatory protein
MLSFRATRVVAVVSRPQLTRSRWAGSKDRPTRVDREVALWTRPAAFCFECTSTCSRTRVWLQSDFAIVCRTFTPCPNVCSRSPMQIHRPIIPKRQVDAVAPAFYRLRDVVRICALSRSTIYRRIADGTFPSQVRLGPRASAWSSDALQTWIDDPAGYRVACNQE